MHINLYQSYTHKSRSADSMGSVVGIELGISVEGWHIGTSSPPSIESVTPTVPRALSPPTILDLPSSLEMRISTRPALARSAHRRDHDRVLGSVGHWLLLVDSIQSHILVYIVNGFCHIVNGFCRLSRGWLPPQEAVSDYRVRKLNNRVEYNLKKHVLFVKFMIALLPWIQ